MNRTENPRRALIVIDVQNDYDGGNLPIEHPPFRDTVGNVAKAMEAAHRLGVQVVVVKMALPANSPVFAAGTHGAELHPAIADKHRDHYVEKSLPSAFTGTDLEGWLRAREIQTVTVAGYMTQNCNLSTIVHAMHMGFDVEYLADASGAVPYLNDAGYASAEDIHRVVTVVLQSRFAAVLDTQEWIECVEKGLTPARDSIPKSNKAARTRTLSAA
jgi:nicotinamidase-related amidase